MRGKSYPIIFVLLISFPVASATTTIILSTQLSLTNAESVQLELYAPQGELSILSSTTQGFLNFTLLQLNSTIIFFGVEPTDGSVSKTVQIDPGEFRISLAMSGNFFPAQVNVTITDTPNDINLGYILTGGVLVILLLPFIYVIGKNQGRSGQ